MQNKEIQQIALELSTIERTCLKTLDKGAAVLALRKLVEDTGLPIDSVRRATQWLKEKQLVDVQEATAEAFVLTEVGEHTKETKLPERRLLDMLLKNTAGLGFREAAENAVLDKQEFSAALGVLKKYNLATIEKQTHPLIQPSELANEFAEKDLPGEQQLNNLQNASAEELESLIKRNLVTRKETVAITLQINDKGKQVLTALKGVGDRREFNINAPVEKLHIGKAQPYNQFIQIMRKKLLELGFTEMKEHLIIQEFYNFDVLFQPQNHPARQWTDSYQLKQPTRGKLPDQKIVNKIRAAHENGGVSKSTGWGYKWNPEIASRLMPTAHGTAMDSRQMCEGVAFPKKYFVINRCFRPDVLDATHLVEFNQFDGFIVGKDLNFRKLLYLLRQFAIEVAGAEEVRFFPDYYPFTEPSVQLSAKHPKLGWIEFAGAGIFRPEITENLGIKEPVLAWGMGIDRLAMFKLGIRDVRYLFSEDLDWLRKAPMVVD